MQIGMIDHLCQFFFCDHVCASAVIMNPFGGTGKRNAYDAERTDALPMYNDGR